MMKKLTALLTALFLLLSATALADEVIHIGIIQFAEHGSLDNCRIGFIEGLAEEGFVEGKTLCLTFRTRRRTPPFLPRLPM